VTLALICLAGAIIFVTLAALLAWTYDRRGDDRIAYDDGNGNCSLESWRHRCEASLRASQARRR